MYCSLLLYMIFMLLYLFFCSNAMKCLSYLYLLCFVGYFFCMSNRYWLPWSLFHQFLAVLYGPADMMFFLAHHSVGLTRQHADKSSGWLAPRRHSISPSYPAACAFPLPKCDLYQIADQFNDIDQHAIQVNRCLYSAISLVRPETSEGIVLIGPN